MEANPKPKLKYYPGVTLADLRTRRKGFGGQSLLLEKGNDFNVDRNQE